MNSELRINPNILSSLDGTNEDLAGWIVNPKFVNKSVVSNTARLHACRVSPWIYMSSKYAVTICPFLCKVDKAGFRIFVNILGQLDSQARIQGSATVA